MHINETEAEYIHKRILSLPTKEERKAYAAIIPKAEALPIAALWRKRIAEQPLQQAETVVLTFVVR